MWAVIHVLLLIKNIFILFFTYSRTRVCVCVRHAKTYPYPGPLGTRWQRYREGLGYLLLGARGRALPSGDDK